MIAFYCSRRSRSSKLSFCSPQGTRAAAVRVRSNLCFFIREERQGGPTPAEMVDWGQALGGHLNIVVRPFCAADTCESSRTEHRLPLGPSRSN